MVFAVPAICNKFCTLKPDLKAPGLRNPIKEDTLCAILTALVILPAVPSQLLFWPDQLLKKEAGLMASVNWVNNFPGFAMPVASWDALFKSGNCA